MYWLFVRNELNNRLEEMNCYKLALIFTLKIYIGIKIMIWINGCFKDIEISSHFKYLKIPKRNVLNK